MDPARTLDIRNSPTETWIRQVLNLLEILQPSQSFSILSDSDITLQVRSVTSPLRFPIALKADQRGPSIWQTRILKLSAPTG